MARRPTPRPVAAPQPTARELLFETWPGRLFLISAAVKVVVALWRATGALPSAARVASAIATIGLVIAVGMFAWRLFTQIKRRLLWRVRSKLILSYIFIGVIPSLLILVFFLFAGSLVFMNVSAYLFKDGYDSIVESARLSAQAAATEIRGNPDRAPGRAGGGAEDRAHPGRRCRAHSPRLPHSPADVQGDLDRLPCTRRQPR